ncbi:maleylacetate reductase [Streptomyces sp. NPDC003247]|uniref:maleylacetate reductase n=1 Tax=Streptomyces sp. NPDC003247 TaxID=3364677 RepID=UPI0036C55F18
MSAGPAPAATEALAFTVPAAPEVLFAPGAVARVGEVLERVGLEHPLVIGSRSSAGIARRIAADLPDPAAGVFDRARVHVPVATVAEAAEAADASGARSVVAVGGGSAVGLAKALALRSGLPYAAVPTTYSGSEMTAVWGLTENGLKHTGTDPSVRATAVVYDPGLTTDLPVDVTVTSGLNAVAHAAEALYAPDRSPLSDLMARDGVRRMATALPALAADPHDEAARAEALCAAWLCGMCLGSTSMSLHHKLCHTLGGALDLPHAPLHALMLPYTLAFNLPAAPAARQALAEALGTDDPVGTLFELDRALGVPRNLGELGVRRSDIERVADLALAAPYGNPRPVDRSGLLALLGAAWAGTPPAV